MTGITAVAVGNPRGGPVPAGPYAQCARIEFGSGALLQLAGQVAVDDDGTLVGPGDVAAQTEQVFTNLERILAAHGAGFGDVVNLRTYLTDMDSLRDYGRVRLARLTGHQPTSTTVEVSRLFLPGALVEVEALAIVASVRDAGRLRA